MRLPANTSRGTSVSSRRNLRMKGTTIQRSKVAAAGSPFTTQGFAPGEAWGLTVKIRNACGLLHGSLTQRLSDIAHSIVILVDRPWIQHPPRAWNRTRDWGRHAQYPQATPDI
jgi:hypothetical protein